MSHNLCKNEIECEPPDNFIFLTHDVITVFTRCIRKCEYKKRKYKRYTRKSKYSNLNKQIKRYWFASKLQKILRNIDLVKQIERYSTVI